MQMLMQNRLGTAKCNLFIYLFNFFLFNLIIAGSGLNGGHDAPVLPNGQR